MRGAETLARPGKDAAERHTERPTICRRLDADKAIKVVLDERLERARALVERRLEVGDAGLEVAVMGVRVRGCEERLGVKRLG